MTAEQPQATHDPKKPLFLCTTIPKFYGVWGPGFHVAAVGQQEVGPFYKLDASHLLVCDQHRLWYGWPASTDLKQLGKPMLLDGMVLPPAP